MFFLNPQLRFLICFRFFFNSSLHEFQNTYDYYFLIVIKPPPTPRVILWLLLFVLEKSSFPRRRKKPFFFSSFIYGFGSNVDRRRALSCETKMELEKVCDSNSDVLLMCTCIRFPKVEAYTLASLLSHSFYIIALGVYFSFTRKRALKENFLPAHILRF